MNSKCGDKRAAKKHDEEEDGKKLTEAERRSRMSNFKAMHGATCSLQDRAEIMKKFHAKMDMHRAQYVPTALIETADSYIQCKFPLIVY